METYAHAFFTWALAKHGVRAGRAAGVAGALGAAFPDVPAFAAAAYYWDQFDSMPREELLNAIYFTGPFGATGTALHSAVVVGALLGLYAAFRAGRFDRRRILLWFLLGWAGHTVVDFLTHVDDTRPLLWPILGWKWSSPVSYYNPAYYGDQFMVVEHALILAIIAGLLARRLYRRGKRGTPTKKGPAGA
jgi:membrane-bound metal-dependent hydrolase YbcI (DUF457 family)